MCIFVRYLLKTMNLDSVKSKPEWVVLSWIWIQLLRKLHCVGWIHKNFAFRLEAKLATFKSKTPNSDPTGHINVGCPFYEYPCGPSWRWHVVQGRLYDRHMQWMASALVVLVDLLIYGTAASVKVSDERAQTRPISDTDWFHFLE